MERIIVHYGQHTGQLFVLCDCDQKYLVGIGYSNKASGTISDQIYTQSKSYKTRI